MKFVALTFAIICVVATLTSAQAPIPYRPDGYQINGPVTAPIQLDAFFDLLCPDCAAAWPNVQQVAEFYGENLALNVHTFPLPYHTYGFTAAQAGHAVLNQYVGSPDAANESAKFLTYMFSVQSNFWNGVAANQTGSEVVSSLVSTISAGGFISQSALAAAMVDDNLNEATRVSWKYACSRGVLGTPTFFVNGVNVNGDPSWTLADWRQVLDPLLEPQPTKKVVKKHHDKKKSQCRKRSHASRKFVTSPTSCPAGEPQCNYSPGKFECCYPGEMCIPNVGCRC